VPAEPHGLKALTQAWEYLMPGVEKQSIE